MDLKKTILKSIMGVGAMKLLALPIGLATSILLARVLGPDGFGQYSFIMALIPLLAIPVSGGLPPLLIREVATYEHGNQWSLYQGALRASHSWVLLVSSTLVLLYWVFAVFGWVPQEGKWGLLPIALLIVPFVGLAAVRTGITKGLGFPAYAEVPNQLIQPVTGLFLFTLLTWTGNLDTQSAISGQLGVAILVFLIASWMFYRVRPPQANKIKPEYRFTHWKKALLPFSMIALVGVFNTQIGIIILGFLSTDEQVAAMRIAERAGQFVIMSLVLVNMVIAPYIVRAYKEGDKALLQSLARKSARGSFLLAFPIASVLILGGELLIGFAFGHDYSVLAYWPVAIIAFGQLSNVFFGSVGVLLSMSGHEQETLKGQILALSINVLLCFLLIPYFGAVGAALAVSIGILSWNSLLWRMVKKHLSIDSKVF